MAHNFRYASTRNVGGHRHTYTVDYDGIGYPKEFDWRPREQRES